MLSSRRDLDIDLSGPFLLSLRKIDGLTIKLVARFVDHAGPDVADRGIKPHAKWPGDRRLMAKVT
ncbi:hypothetical protein ASD89_02015 [Caulobacter sp. Root656]|nr:hypothetical protein ASD89_02015 [Caulobacter sp. Root656]